MTSVNHRSYCPISSALDLFGDKWSLLIVRDILISAKRTHKEFRASEEAVATNILGDRIARLEQLGILTREVNPEDARSEIFSLTPKGVDLLPILLALAEWSGKHDNRLNAPPVSPQVARLTAEMRILMNDIEAGENLRGGRQIWKG